MSPILFWIFSGLMLGFAVMVVFHRNPVASALSLVVSFVALAAIFVSLNAFFIGTIQVLVYAGAVMVLFLFIIMLLDLKAEVARRLNPGMVVGGVAVALAFGTIVVGVIEQFPDGAGPFPALVSESPAAAGTPAGSSAPLPFKVDDVKHVGRTLFTDYNLPLQVIGALVLVATIGVVVLSKKELK